MSDMAARAAAAAAAWDLVAGAPELLHERENAVFRVPLSSGAMAALRLHRPGYQSPEGIAAELRLTEALAEAGFPCPRPIRTSAGALTSDRDGELASMVSWCAGAPLGAANPGGQPGTRCMARLGALTARMHGAIDAFGLPPLPRPAWDAEGLLGEAPVWGRFWESPALAPAEAALLAEAREWARARLAEMEAPDFGLIHADLMVENVLDDGAALALIDFDDCGTGYRAYDLGTALVQHLGAPRLGELADALVQGYAATRGVPEARVRRDLPLFVLLRAMASCGWIVPRTAPDDPRRRAYATRAVRLARAVMGGAFPVG